MCQLVISVLEIMEIYQLKLVMERKSSEKVSKILLLKILSLEIFAASENILSQQFSSKSDFFENIRMLKSFDTNLHLILQGLKTLLISYKFQCLRCIITMQFSFMLSLWSTSTTDYRAFMNSAIYRRNMANMLNYNCSNLTIFHGTCITDNDNQMHHTGCSYYLDN